ncbi:MAG: type II toxin-antitoxin system VapB family antitoxin [Phycisphaeraceae bacterium]|nr:type II toxin-antitoxin system VapB family antitoxin [Phycisphaeraceae bacterium]MBX3405722.1 type II toxin-antitoxin system VapB family antitoxin [Phycisphaeraceae bacterium]
MRTTLNIRTDLLDEARRQTGIKRKTDLVHAGLEELLRAAAIRRLINAGGKFPKFGPAPRRRRSAKA